jgi:Ser/Thr protein kinase RdoA (MazF antagonist)
LRDCYGADGDLVSHAGEEACNVEMRNREQRWMVKALPASWPHALAELQTHALEHAARHGCASLLPRLVRTKEGHATARIEHDGKARSVFVTTFLPGRAFADIAPLKPALLRSVGRALGQLSRALAGFEHPAAHRELRWDLLQAEWIGGELDAISDLARGRSAAALVGVAALHRPVPLAPCEERAKELPHSGGIPGEPTSTRLVKDLALRDMHALGAREGFHSALLRAQLWN